MRSVDVVGITASTGGPAGVATLLQGLGSTFAAPILVVQHMAANFLDGYAAWLDTVCDLDVAVARDLETPVAGRVYVAPGDCHLTYRAGRIHLVGDSGGSSGHVPSGDILFASLAGSLGARALGVLLSGMGDDGAKGLLAMRLAGAHTIAQDRSTSAVYGMPAAACALGAASEQLAIGSIAGRIAHLVCDTTKREDR
jgi:two-component system chemotaxis response regulator CheB